MDNGRRYGLLFLDLEIKEVVNMDFKFEPPEPDTGNGMFYGVEYDSYGNITHAYCAPEQMAANVKGVRVERMADIHEEYFNMKENRVKPREAWVPDISSKIGSITKLNLAKLPTGSRVIVDGASISLEDPAAAEIALDGMTAEIVVPGKKKVIYSKDGMQFKTSSMSASPVEVKTT